MKGKVLPYGRWFTMSCEEIQLVTWQVHWLSRVGHLHIGYSLLQPW